MKMKGFVVIETGMNSQFSAEKLKKLENLVSELGEGVFQSFRKGNTNPKLGQRQMLVLSLVKKMLNVYRGVTSTVAVNNSLPKHTVDQQGCVNVTYNALSSWREEGGSGEQGEEAADGDNVTFAINAARAKEVSEICNNCWLGDWCI